MFWLSTLVAVAALVAALSWMGRARGSARGASGHIDDRAHLARGKDEGRNFYGPTS